MQRVINKRNDELYIEIPYTDREIILGQAVTNIDIKETAEIYDDEYGQLRLYCTYVGDSDKNENAFNLQIRARQPLKDRNKPRNIIATISLTTSELIALGKYAEAQASKDKTFIKPVEIIEEDPELTNLQR